MCRLTAYLGPPITLGQWVGEPPLAALAEAAAFGIGWYAPDTMPACYAGRKPLCMDGNFPALSRSLTSTLWLTHALAVPTPNIPCIAQPLCDEDFLFAYCGALDEFRTGVRPLMRNFLMPEIEAGIETHGEAEYVFAMLRHLLDDDADMSIEQALAETCNMLDEWMDGASAQLNVVMSDGENLYALRYAVNAVCQPLYFTADDESYPNAQVIASQPLTAAEFWRPVPDHHILILDPYEPPELVSL